jgi:UDP-N-acetylmuramoyl-L-alanyl-D-glutamate--2,6-diaminopimelate ligase
MKGAELMRAVADADPQMWRPIAGLDLTGVTADSRKAAPGMLFAALPGSSTDGQAFIGDAVRRGAVAVLATTGTQWPPGVPPRPMITDPEPRRCLAQIAAKLAGAQPAQVVAVTGTNGKTSTAEFLRQLWQLAGRQAASLGTLGLIAPGFATGPGLTTPDPVALSGTLAQLARAGVQSAAIEASSHGLDQFRLDGVRLVAGAFTNLTRDHLDYHGDMAAYRTAKLRLFADLLPEGAPAIASTSLDDETLAALRAIAARRRLDFRVAGPDSTVPQADGQMVVFEDETLFLPLVGRFQADNAILAALLAEATGVAGARQLLAKLCGVRGRLERVATLPNGAAAYIDFAHTPDALDRMIAAMRPHTAGRLVVVFGAGGDRDPGKRAPMGRAASAADIVIVTDDNPRTEQAAAIRAAVMEGCHGAFERGDRAEAIAAAMSDLGPGDVLVVAGKGHEQGQIIGTETLPFDDAVVIRALAGQRSKDGA